MAPHRYPTHPYYLDDLWYFDISSGLWTEVQVISRGKPMARTDHTLEISGNVLFLFGGYSHNHHHGDTWLFNTSSYRWLEKDIHPEARYPDTCIDDWEAFIHNSEVSCLLLEEQVELLRLSLQANEIMEASAQLSSFALTFQTEVIPFSGPVMQNRAYFTIVDRVDDPWTTMPTTVNWFWLYDDEAFAQKVSHPRQYVTLLNASAAGVDHASWWGSNGTVFMRCTSTFGDPTRFIQPLNHTLIAIPRRQSPGWDGCRDRFASKEGFPDTLSFVQPMQRSEHRSARVLSGDLGKDGDAIFLLGGLGYAEELLPTTRKTHETQVRADMWRLGVHECLNNCSSHGVCEFGFCYCHEGFYGTDCSNSSCPGDFCSYDNATHQQHCQHCCHSGYVHHDGDDAALAAGIEKAACNLERPGKSNGICDGYGHCNCAPPFIGDDCSIRDCDNKCNLNGVCSVEYPISRCVCNPGYYGPSCQFRNCLNNCSFPRGLCNASSGACKCLTQKNPYFNKQNYTFFKATGSRRRRGEWITVGEFRDDAGLDSDYTNGIDCSYIMAYAAASTLKPSRVAAIAMFLLGLMMQRVELF